MFGDQEFVVSDLPPPDDVDAPAPASDLLVSRARRAELIRERGREIKRATAEAKAVRSRGTRRK